MSIDKNDGGDTADAYVQFGRVPSDLIFSGSLQLMDGNDAKVYLCLAAHSDQHWETRVGQRRISELTGLFHGRVSESMRRLIDLKLIELVEPGSGKRAAVLRLSAPPGRSAKVQDYSSSAPVERGAKDDERRSLRPGNSGLAPRKNTLSAPPQRNETEEQKEQSMHAACSEIRQKLAKAGVAGPNLQRLASNAHVTLAMVEGAISTEAGPGLIVRRVEDRIAAAEQKATEAKSRTEKADARRQAAEAAWRAIPKCSSREEMAEARAWAEEVHMPRVREILRHIACPGLFFCDERGIVLPIVGPEADENVLYAAWRVAKDLHGYRKPGSRSEAPTPNRQPAASPFRRVPTPVGDPAQRLATLKAIADGHDNGEANVDHAVGPSGGWGHLVAGEGVICHDSLSCAGGGA